MDFNNKKSNNIYKYIYKNQTFLICSLYNNVKSNFQKNIIFNNNPSDHRLDIVKKFHNKIAKYNNYILSYFNQDNYKLIVDGWYVYNPKYKYNNIYTETILNLKFNDIKKLNRILFIDLTYTCDYMNYLNNKIKNIIDTFQTFLNAKNITPNLSIIFSPKYSNILRDEINKGDNYYLKELMINKKQDFIYFSGGLDYNLIKTITYYNEQFHSLYFFFQVFYILHNQKKKGSFIISLSYIISTDYGITLIRLLKKYYEEISLVRDLDYESNYLYIVGKNFIGIDKKDKKILKDIIEFTKNKSFSFKFGENLNIYDNNLRKEHYITKNISTLILKDSFFNNIIEFNKNDIEFINIIDEYNKKIINYINKKYPNRYKTNNR